MKGETFVIYTIGHSTRELLVFLKLLQGYGIKQLVDVRTIPRSLKNPQYNAETLPKALRSAGIRYVHLSALGGLRRAARHSINTGWRNASFRGFADYMQGAEFEKGLEQLIEIDIGKRSPAFPVTPPYVRVRIRRFGGLSDQRTVNLGIPSESK